MFLSAAWAILVGPYRKYAVGTDTPEPWLRGSMADVHPLLMPVFFSFAQVREDLDRHTSGLSEQQVWCLFGQTSLGFHLRHIAGSVDRLGTYLLGEELSEDQLNCLHEERTPSGSITELIADIHLALNTCEARLRQINPDELYKERAVGRQHLPTTVIGLLTHLAEHTQRHLGQAITLSQILRQSS